MTEFYVVTGAGGKHQDLSATFHIQHPEKYQIPNSNGKALSPQRVSENGNLRREETDKRAISATNPPPHVGGYGSSGNFSDALTSATLSSI